MEIFVGVIGNGGDVAVVVVVIVVLIFSFSSICCCLHNSIASDAQSLAAMVQATPLESFSHTGGKTSSLSQKKPKYSAPKMSHLCPFPTLTSALPQ